MDVASKGHSKLPSVTTVSVAVRKNANSLRSAISSERLQSLVPVLFGNGVLRYEEYEHLEKLRGQLRLTDVVEKIAASVEKWIKSHHAQLSNVADSMKQFKSFHRATLSIRNDLDGHVCIGPQDESSLQMPRDEERLSRVAVGRSSSAEGKSSVASVTEVTEDRFSFLRSKYEDTFAQVKGIVCKHIPVERLREQLCCQWLGVEGDEKVKTSHQLMDLFWKRSCTFPYLHELVTLVDALGIGSAQRIADDYERMRDKLYGQTSVEEFSKLSLEEDFHEKNIKIEFVSDWNEEDVTLQGFEDFVGAVFGFLHTHISLRVIRRQPLTFLCSAPFFSAKAIARIVLEKKQALLERKVVSITVGSSVIFKADSSAKSPTELVNGTETADSLRQELEQQLRDEVRKELRNELMDEVEDVQYDEVPVEGLFGLKEKLKKLQDDVSLLLDDVNTGTDLEEVGPQRLKHLRSKLKEVSALVASSARLLETPLRESDGGKVTASGMPGAEMNGNICSLSSQEGEKCKRWTKMKPPSHPTESELQMLSVDLGDVVQWFSLGVFLGLPPHELERLKQPHGCCRECLVPMLDLWLKTGPVDYSKLVAALEHCGLSTLAKSLSVKYGVVVREDKSPVQSPTVFERVDPFSVGFGAKDHNLLVKKTEIEAQEREVAQLTHQIQQLERRSKELAKNTQTTTTSLDEAMQRSKVLTDQRKELLVQLEQKRMDRTLLCKQGSNEQSAIKLLTETEMSIKTNSNKMTGIEAEIQKHESYETEVRQKLQTLEAELKKEAGALQKIKKQLSQSKATLEKRSRQFDAHLQHLISQQSSTADLPNSRKISRPKKELPRNDASSSTAQNSSQANNKGGARVVLTVSMDKHLAALHQRLQQDVAVNGDSNSVEMEANHLWPEYYYEGITALDAERILTQEKNLVGTFLVWSDLENSDHKTVISVLGKDRVCHCIITHEIVERYPTTESFVEFFKDTPNTLQCCPIVACRRSNHLESLEPPETCAIELDQHIRESRFANLWTGYFGEERKRVLVKSMKRGHSSACQFESEAIVMKELEHANILSIQAFVTGQQPYIITESVVHASLHHYFTKYKHREMETSSLVNIAAQVACGMSYLESLKCIHRNLAARNVMLSGRGAKIANFSQACYTPSNKFVCDPGMILLRWTAPEVLSEHTFSSKSDVWSFGILLWEMFTHGELPYPKMKDDNVREKIKSGYRLPKPKRCLQSAYTVMTECWKSVPDERPNFSSLADKLTEQKHGANGYYTIVY